MNFIKTIGEYWAQLTVFAAAALWGIKEIIRSVLNVKAKRDEIRVQAWEDRKLDRIETFLRHTAIMKNMWFSISHDKLLNNGFNPNEYDMAYTARIIDMDKSLRELALYISDNQYKLLAKIIESNRLISSSAIDIAGSFKKPSIQELNAWITLVNKNTHENDEFIAKFLFQIRKKYN